MGSSLFIIVWFAMDSLSRWNYWLFSENLFSLFKCPFISRHALNRSTTLSRN